MLINYRIELVEFFYLVIIFIIFQVRVHQQYQRYHECIVSTIQKVTL